MDIYIYITDENSDDLKKNIYIMGAVISNYISKSTQSAAGLNVLRPAANGRYIMCKSLPCYNLHLL